MYLHNLSSKFPLVNKTCDNFDEYIFYFHSVIDLVSQQL